LAVSFQLGAANRCSVAISAPPDHLVVALADAELPVRAPEFTEVWSQLVAIFLATLSCGDLAKGGEEAAALHIHGGREHGPDLGIHGEQLGVEVCHCRSSDRLKQPE
jgi:hypothetical protein